MTLIIYSSEAGQLLGQSIQKQIPDSCLMQQKEFSAKDFQENESIIFVGAMGICVRTIAPFCKDKYQDPAVICVDSMGKHVISVLSGHVGGANELTRQVARILGAEPIITTQSDNEGLWALDTMAKENGWQEEHDGGSMNDIIAHFVNKKPTTLKVDVLHGHNKLQDTCPEFVSTYDDQDAIATQSKDSLLIALSHLYHPEVTDKKYNKNLYFRPPVLHIGIGCAKGCKTKDYIERIIALLHDHNLSEKSVATIGTIPLKADEPLVKSLQQALPWAKTCIYETEQLADVEVPHPSEYAMKYLGIPSVSEACAMMSGTLLVEKTKLGDTDDHAEVTIAVSITPSAMTCGHVEFVGAGPGDPELISVRGMHLLQQADLILYAGSLVPKRLTYYAKDGCMVRSSADMNLEQQVSLMKEFYDQHKLIVRLHTGDPCIYGAIQEQMALMDQYNMHYHITPGISAFQAAAAALESQFTIPEKVQTIILTRGEGRTPMPEKEQLHRLAQSQSTMCIYLSAAIAEDVQAELLQAYSPETPVAACYKLTWPEEKIYRGQLKDLAKIVKDNNLTLTTLLVVGEAIDNRKGLSRLYADEFKHLFRK